MTHRNVVAVGAHPSDLEFHAGATLAGLAASGARVRLFVCSDVACGPGGGREMAATRREEARRAAEVLGECELVWSDVPGEEVVPGEPLLRGLVREIRRQRADLVLAHDPTTLWRQRGGVTRLGHADHRAAGHAVLNALHPRVPMSHFYPELSAEAIQPWLVPELWLFDTASPDHFVDVAGTWHLKQAALSCHASQVSIHLIEEANAEAEAVRERTGFRAEGFRRLCLL